MKALGRTLLLVLAFGIALFNGGTPSAWMAACAVLLMGVLFVLWDIIDHLTAANAEDFQKREAARNSYWENERLRQQAEEAAAAQNIGKIRPPALAEKPTPGIKVWGTKE